VAGARHAVSRLQVSLSRASVFERKGAVGRRYLHVRPRRCVPVVLGHRESEKKMDVGAPSTLPTESAMAPNT